MVIEVRKVELNKRRCRECGWVGRARDVLRGRNPFDLDYEIFGCPSCKEIDELVEVCDEPGCEREATIGTPSSAGYRRVCREHDPGRCL